MKTYIILIGICLFVTITARSQAPVITDINPTHGTVDELVTLRGSGFGTDASKVVVFFGAAASESIVQISDTEIQVLVPAGATVGSISVVNLATGLAGYSSELFTLSYDGFEFDTSKLDAPVSRITTGDDLYSFCVCDLNRDGRNDIVTANTKNEASLLQNRTNSVDADSFNLSVVDVRQARWVRCGDIDSDGKPDLIFTFSNESTNTNQVAVYRNTTDISDPTNSITFETNSEATYFAVDGDIGGRTVIRDIDGDGKPEIVAADLTGRGGVSIFRNNSTPGSISFDTSPILPFDLLNIDYEKDFPAVDADDLNGDGLPDIVASNGSKEVYVFTNTSTPGTIEFSTYTTLTSVDIENLRVGDIDGDGQADVVISSRKYLGIFRNTTDDTGISFAREAKFNNVPSQVNGGSLNYIGLDLADMDGNGQLDVIRANEDASPRYVTVIFNTSNEGALSFTKTQTLETVRTRTARGADFNGDGKPDLAYTDITTDQLVIRLNRNCIQPVLEPKDGLSVCDVLPYTLRATRGVGLAYQWETSDDGTNFTPVLGATAATYTTADEKFFRVKVSSTIASETCPTRASNVVKVIRPEGFVPTRPIIINPDPATPYCFGEDVTIQTQNINAEFIWTDPEGNVIPGANTNVLVLENVTAEHVGVYSVYVQASPEQGGCVSDIATTEIKVSEPPAINVASDKPPVLLDDQTSLTLSITPADDHTYAWRKDGQPVGGATAPSLTVNEAGAYVATITNSLGCVRESPVFRVAAGQPEIPTAVCQNAATDYRVLPDLLNGVAPRYRWTFGDGNAQEGAAVTYGYPQAGEFQIVVEVLGTDNNPTSRYEQTVTVFASPELDVTTDGKRHLCPGETVTLTGNRGFNRYAWDTGETEASITVAQAGTYSLTVTTNDGCTLTQAIEVRDVPNPEALITASAERVSLGDTLQLTASGGATYRWSPATGLSDTTVANPVARPLVTTDYTCVVTTEDSCSVVAEYTVYVDRSLDVVPQKIFSPNYDGQNDTWLINKMELYPDCRLTMFDRQGIKVFERENYANDNPWDGTSNGQLVPPGVYFYLINCGDEAGQQTGSVTIVR